MLFHGYCNGSETPADLAVDLTSGSGWLGLDEFGTVLLLTLVKKIPADQGQFQRFDRPPAETHVKVQIVGQPVVLVIPAGTDIAPPQVQFDIFRQLQLGAERYLV